MPYEWVTDTTGERAPKCSVHTGDAPAFVLHAWPYRSLSRRGFTIFIAATSLLLLVPLVPLIGTPVLWGILPFLLAALAAIWLFLQRSYKDGTVLEELKIWSDRIALVRHNPRSPTQEWESDPYWAEVEMHKSGGPVPNYVTLRGGGREVEIGAFLSEDERHALYSDLQFRLRHASGKG